MAEVKNTKFYAIIADEAAYFSNNEQMSLVLRFVDRDNHIREDFQRFIHCNQGLHGSEQATVILKGICDLGLDIHNCRGQLYYLLCNISYLAVDPALLIFPLIDTVFYI